MAGSTRKFAVEADPLKFLFMLTGRLRRLVQRPLAAVCVFTLVLIFGASALAPLMAPWDPNQADFLAALQGPSAEHWLGTDPLGRDLLSRLLYSGITLLGYVVLASVVAAVIGIPAGLMAGLQGGRVDTLVGRVSDILQAVPSIVVFLTVLAVFRQDMNAAMVALGVFVAPSLARVVRAATLSVRQETYVTAARVAGLTQTQIAISHILPRVMGPVVVSLSIRAATALLTTTGLNFIGLGVKPPDPTWGSMVAEASAVMAESRWMLVPTGLLVFVTVLAFVLLGDALRDQTAEVWGGGGARSRGRKAPNLLDQPAGEAPTDGALVEVRQLSLAVPSDSAEGGWQTLVDEVSFSIRPGECLGVVGESGCGKSLTGLGLLGLLPAGVVQTRGQIWYGGRDLCRIPAAERARLRGNTIAFVSQEPMVALDPVFTVGSQLSELIGVHEPALSAAQRHERALALLVQVQIRNAPEVLERYPSQLSGGMAQRVCIAMALAGRPRLIVADEPTTALDVTVQAEIIRLLREIQQQTGMALLLITHDWSVVTAICDRAIVMYAGQVVESADRASLLAKPLHPYTQGLLAANPHLTPPGQPLPQIAGTVPAPANWPRHCRFAERCAQADAACRAAPVPLSLPDGTRSVRCVKVQEVRHV
ncbi:MAG: oligopeptide/dipeptide transporter, ATPase subunit [Pseudomonadota bacterium]